MLSPPLPLRFGIREADLFGLILVIIHTQWSKSGDPGTKRDNNVMYCQHCHFQSLLSVWKLHQPTILRAREET